MNFLCVEEKLTGVERLKLLAGDFCIVHAIEKWCNAGIVLAPKVVRN
jgi:hypothetical protein